MTTEELFMKKTFDLAIQGMGHVSPNPLVGAIIVKDDIIIGSGYHEEYGGFHAEVNAINSSKECVAGGTLYCNLEPCCHYKKQTPPCAPMLIKSKIKKVVISTLDPNPEVSGRGVQLLRDAGIEVVIDVLKSEGTLLNEVFFHNIKSNKPFIHVKLAQTLDGKIATLNGDSKWISSESARKEVHGLRLKYDAVMIGRNTLTRDDAKLSIRMGIDAGGKVPYRIIVGKIEKFDLSLAIFNDEFTNKNIIITNINDYRETPEFLLEQHKKLGTKIIFKDNKSEPQDFLKAFVSLYDLSIMSILVEGGAQLINELILTGLVDKFSFYICPILLGEGKSYFLKEEVASIREAIHFDNCSVRNLEGQAVMEFYPKVKLNQELPCSPV